MKLIKLGFLFAHFEIDPIEIIIVIIDFLLLFRDKRRWFTVSNLILFNLGHQSLFMLLKSRSVTTVLHTEKRA